jgi:uncharacterized protein YutE (UPF0331/DUF86 family)
MVDVQTVVERLEALKAYIAELDHYAQHSLGELTSDFVRYRAAQHSLQLASQAVVDIATHIITADFTSRVQDYRQAIRQLGQEGVLPAAFAERLAPIAGFRNILVHEYLAVDPARLYDVLIHGRQDLQEFCERISEYLRRTDALNDEVTYE